MKNNAAKHTIGYNYLTDAQLSVFTFQLHICIKYGDFYDIYRHQQGHTANQYSFFFMIIYKIDKNSFRTMEVQ